MSVICFDFYDEYCVACMGWSTDDSWAVFQTSLSSWPGCIMWKLLFSCNLTVFVNTYIMKNNDCSNVPRSLVMYLNWVHFTQSVTVHLSQLSGTGFRIVAPDHTKQPFCNKNKHLRFADSDVISSKRADEANEPSWIKREQLWYTNQTFLFVCVGVCLVSVLWHLWGNPCMLNILLNQRDVGKGNGFVNVLLNHSFNTVSYYYE